MIGNVFHIIILMCLCSLAAFSQIENVRVETYYISNNDDATDTIGGHLEKGNTTYRIFIDLLPGSKLLAIYGDEDHPLVFSSTAPFFNHREEGVTFAKDLNRNRYSIGTLPLDTYITLGQCSKSFSQGAYFGIPKEKDQDGSVIGGANNDGGSQEIASGLLINDNDEIGIPLTTADGLVFTNELPDSWIEIGFKDILTEEDTTIFGLNKSSFKSTNVLLRNSGVTGVDTGQNEILVAQLTTKGDVSFEINLEVEILKDGNHQTVKYVAQNETLAQDEFFEPLLSYPYTCGCKDPDYMEASPSFACTDNSYCKTLIVFGCMDSLACNYNSMANFNVSEICCYPGYCHDLDISVACPDLAPRKGNNSKVSLHPNPVLSGLFIEQEAILHNDINYIISDLSGRVLRNGIIKGGEKYIDVLELDPGYFILQLRTEDKIVALPFVKL